MLKRILWSLATLALLSSSASAQFWVPTTNIIGFDEQPLSNNPVVIPGDTAIYASNFEGLYRSIDRGVTWSLVSQQMKNEQWNVKKIIKTKQGTLVATRYDDGALYSTDNGETWAESQGLPFMLVQNIVQHPDGALFASVRENVIMRSIDEGKNWSALNNGLPEGYWGEALVLLNNGDLIVGTGFNGSYGIYRSTNKGANWTKINAIDHVLVLALVQDEQGRIFAGTEGGGILRSTDNGLTWQLTDTTGVGLTTVESIAIGNDSTIFAGMEGYGVFRSSDGHTWTATQPTISNPNQIAVAMDGHVYAGVTGGMVRSTESTGNRIPPSGTEHVKAASETNVRVTRDIRTGELMVTGLLDGTEYFFLDILGREVTEGKVEGGRISTRIMVRGTYLLRLEGVAFLVTI